MFFSYGRDDVVDDRDASDAGGGGHDSDTGRRSRRGFGCHYPALLYGPVHRLQNTVSVCFITTIRTRFPRRRISFALIREKMFHYCIIQFREKHNFVL